MSVKGMIVSKPVELGCSKEEFLSLLKSNLEGDSVDKVITLEDALRSQRLFMKVYGALQEYYLSDLSAMDWNDKSLVESCYGVEVYHLWNSKSTTERSRRFYLKRWSKQYALKFLDLPLERVLSEALLLSILLRATDLS